MSPQVPAALTLSSSHFWAFGQVRVARASRGGSWQGQAGISLLIHWPVPWLRQVPCVGSFCGKWGQHHLPGQTALMATANTAVGAGVSQISTHPPGGRTPPAISPGPKQGGATGLHMTKGCWGLAR